jgi:hypothetical protein
MRSGGQRLREKAAQSSRLCSLLSSGGGGSRYRFTLDSGWREGIGDEKEEPSMCSLTALMVRCKASGLRYMPMRSIGLRNDESCAYAAEFSVIFESSKHVTGFGVRCGTPCAFMLPAVSSGHTLAAYLSRTYTSTRAFRCGRNSHRVENMDEPAAPISGCGLAETVGEDTTAFAPILGRE